MRPDLMAAIHWYRSRAASSTRPRSAPLVLLHGFTGSPASWAEVASLLPDEVAIAALALPGHDADVPVADGFTANLERLADTIRAADLAGCRLIGYSLGARTALGLAVSYPELVGALALIGAHPGIIDAAERKARRERDKIWIARLEEDGLAAFINAWERLPLFSHQAHLPMSVQARQRQIRAGHDPHALAASLVQMGLAAMPNYRPKLIELAMPVTWIAGMSDAKFTALARTTNASMQAHGCISTLVEVPDCGHNPLLEAPAALARILLA